MEIATVDSSVILFDPNPFPFKYMEKLMQPSLLCVYVCMRIFTTAIYLPVRCIHIAFLVE